MHYCLQWENPSNFPDFAEYIKRVPNDPFSANCSICRGKPFQLSNIGKRALKSHAEGEKHQDALRLRRTVGPLFTPAVPEGEPSTEIPHQPAEKEAEVGNIVLQEVSEAPQTSFVILFPYFASQVYGAVKFSKLALCFDEAFNSVINKGRLDVHCIYCIVLLCLELKDCFRCSSRTDTSLWMLLVSHRKNS